MRQQSDSDQQDSWDLGEDRGATPALPAFLLDPVGVLQRRWPWLAAVAVVGFAASTAAFLLWQPVYVAQSTVLISSQQIPEDFVRSTVRQDSVTNVNAMVAEVLSRQNLARLLDRLDLYQEERDQTTDQELVDRVRSNAQIGPIPDPNATRKRKGSGSLIYAIQFESDEPEQAAVIANALAGLLIDASITRRHKQARRATEFLTRELERDERELREHSAIASEFRRNHRGELPSELNTNLAKLDLLSQRRQSLITQIAAKENRIVALASAPGEVAPVEDRLLLDELRRLLARELAAHTEHHPNVGALRRRIEAQETLVAEPGEGSSAALAGEAAQRELALLKSQLRETEASIVDRNERVDRTPATAEQLGALEQKEQVLREDYISNLRKVQQAKLAESLESAQQGAQVSILDRASAPRKPRQPRSLVLIAGLVATLAAAIGLAVLLEFVDPVLVSVSQLERLSEPPVLGSLPRIA